MQKIKMQIDECKIGSILATDVWNEKGSLIIAEGAVLSEPLKNSLKALGITDLWISPPKEEDSLPENMALEMFQNTYTQQVDRLKYIVKDLITGENFELDNLNEIVDSVRSEIDHNHHLVGFLHEMKKFDDYTFTHSLNVAFYCALICKWTNTNAHKTRNIIMTGLLHDIGKSMLPISLLYKKEKLLPEEADIIKMHTVYGYNLVKDMLSIDSDIKLGILLHHERENGMGYPMNLRKHQLNLNTKIVSVADAYDAMVSDRPYRKAYTPFQAFHIMTTEDLLSFDIDILNTFIRSISHYFIGSSVILNTHEIGKVVHIPLHALEKPIICVNSDFIDLSKESTLEIVGMVE